MEHLAPIYALDLTTAQTIGLLHDAAKNLDADAQLVLAHGANLPLCELCETNPLYLHDPMGAYRIAKALGVDDPAILDTISRHSYCGVGPGLSPSYCWCLRFADILEPRHDWEALKQRLSSEVYAGKILKGAHILLH